MVRVLPLLLLFPAIAWADPAPLDRAEVDRLVTTAMKEWSVPGCSIVLVRDGKVVHVAGYGAKNSSKPEPIDADTVFPLASCTKAFTAAVLARLVDDRHLDWDDPVRKHLPWYRLSDANADALVTIRDLVTHRSGYASVEHDLLWYRAPWSIEEVVRRANRLAPDGLFRSSYRYSSIQFMAAGLAAAHRAGKPWDRLTREVICDPLGMTSVAFTDQDLARLPNQASGHRRAKDGSVETMPRYPTPEANPSGSMHASARDLGAWIRLQLGDGSFDGKRVISAANLVETKTPHTIMRRDAVVGPVYPDSVQVSYGMGWVVYDHRGEKVVAHGGVVDGFRAQVTLLPDRSAGFAILTNMHQTRMNLALGNVLIDRLCNLSEKDWHRYYQKLEQSDRDARQAMLTARDQAADRSRGPSLLAKDYVGEYSHPAYETGRITLTEKGLVWTWGSQICPLVPYSGEQFRITAGLLEDQLLEFAIEGGKTVALRWAGQVYRRK